MNLRRLIPIFTILTLAVACSPDGPRGNTAAPVATESWTTLVADTEPEVLLSHTAGEGFVEAYDAPSLYGSRTALAADANNRLHIIFNADQLESDTSGLYYHRLDP